VVKKEEAVLRFEWRDIAHTTALFRGVKTEEVGCRLRPSTKRILGILVLMEMWW